MVDYSKKIIALYGPSGCGKDTIAKIIRNTTLPFERETRIALKFKELIDPNPERDIEGILAHSRFEVKKFAAGPKEIVSQILGVHVERLEDRQYKKEYLEKYDRTVLQLLIDVAQGMRKIVSDDVWCESLLNQYKDQYWIITDLRFPCEYERLREMGAIIAKIENPDVKSDLPIDNLLDDYKFDHVITNIFNRKLEVVRSTRDMLLKYNIVQGYDNEYKFRAEYLNMEDDELG